MFYQVDKKGLISWLNTLSGSKELFVPRGPQGFGPYQGEIPFWGRTKLSAKEFYLPFREILFRFQVPAQELPNSFVLPRSERIIFGLKPCEAKGKELVAQVFAQDPLFKERLSKTIFIGLGCESPYRFCFCGALGLDPFEGKGLDLLIWPLGEEFLIKSLTPKGNTLLTQFPLPKASEGGISLWEELRKGFLARFHKAPVLEQLDQKEVLDLYSASFWDELALACINCGTCSFLCPTCYCFDVQDEVQGRRGVRIRFPDSCMFEIYSRHASGHNPRSSPTARFRNRFLHKFKYYPQRHGEFLCVGCGRCLEYCPAGVDLWQVLRAMAKA